MLILCLNSEHLNGENFSFSRHEQKERQAELERAAKEKENCLFRLLKAMQKKHEEEILYLQNKQNQICEGEKQDLQGAFNRQVDRFLLYLYQYEEILGEKNKELENYKHLNQKFEYLLHLLLVEFQKFIDFALRAVPGQAEFLLKSILELLKGLRLPEPPEPKGVPTRKDEELHLVRVQSYVSVLHKHPSLLNLVAPYGVTMPDIKPPGSEITEEVFPPLPPDQPPVYPERPSYVESIFSVLFNNTFGIDKQLSVIVEESEGESVYGDIESQQESTLMTEINLQ